MGRRAIQQVVGRGVDWLELLEPAIERAVVLGLHLTSVLLRKSLKENVKAHLAGGLLYKSPHCTSASSRSSGSAPLPLPSPPLQRLSLQILTIPSICDSQV